MTRSRANDPANEADPSGLYNADGHFYTTYLVAMAAGMSDDDAFNLAYYSQLPDQIPEYNAYDSDKEVLETAFMDKEQEKWAKAVSTWLHFLNNLSGEEIEARRDCMKQLFKKEGLTTWQQGFILHALADSYAHVYKDADETMRAWKWFPGHAWRGHKPDIIANHVGKYKLYVQTLYGLLGGKGEAENNPKIKALFDNVNDLPKDAKDALSKMKDYAQSAGYTRKYFPNDGHNIIPGVSVPGKDNVRSLIETMAESCGR